MTTERTWTPSPAQPITFDPASGRLTITVYTTPARPAASGVETAAHRRLMEQLRNRLSAEPAIGAYRALLRQINEAEDESFAAAQRRLSGAAAQRRLDELRGRRPAVEQQALAVVLRQARAEKGALSGCAFEQTGKQIVGRSADLLDSVADAVDMQRTAAQELSAIGAADAYEEGILVRRLLSELTR